jgi:hypothetical protein
MHRFSGVVCVCVSGRCGLAAGAEESGACTGMRLQSYAQAFRESIKFHTDQPLAGALTCPWVAVF